MLFIFDWDGTLGGMNALLSKKDAIAIEKLNRMGHTVIIATGRHPREIVDMTNGNPNISRYIIGANGGLIFDKNTNKIIYQSNIKQKYNYEIIKLAKKYKSFIWYMDEEYVNFVHYGSLAKEKWGVLNKQTIRHFSEIDESIFDSELALMGIKIGDRQAMKKEYKKMTTKYKNKIALTSVGAQYIQFNDFNTNKWSGIKWLKNHIKSNEKTVCFGDAGNDAEMIKGADIGVAMGNSTDFILNLADITIGGCEENGIFNFVNKIEKDPSILKGNW